MVANLNIYHFVVCGQLPGGLAGASSIRIGVALGAGNPEGARQAAYVALIIIGDNTFFLSVYHQRNS